MAAEKLFENKIKNFLKDNACWNVKFFANSFTKVGVPDILTCVNGYFVAIEVKGPTGKPSEIQKYNVKKIVESGGFAVIAKPAQYGDLTQMIRCLIYSDKSQAKEICEKMNKSWNI